MPLKTTHINLFSSLSLFGGLPLRVQLKLLLDVELFKYELYLKMQYLAPA